LLNISAIKIKSFCFGFKVFVQGSSRLGPAELGSSFGYLKASSNLTTVNLYIMPYNYPELSTLLSTKFLTLSSFDHLFDFKVN
jgi:hypothetical protein